MDFEGDLTNFRLIMRDNNLQCNCDLKWLQTKTLKKPKIICDGPEEMNGENVLDALSRNYFNFCTGKLMDKYSK